MFLEQECRDMNSAVAAAAVREKRRGMHEYFKALVYVDALRNRGVWLKPCSREEVSASGSQVRTGDFLRFDNIC